MSGALAAFIAAGATLGGAMAWRAGLGRHRAATVAGRFGTAGAAAASRRPSPPGWFAEPFARADLASWADLSWAAGPAVLVVAAAGATAVGGPALAVVAAAAGPAAAVLGLWVLRDRAGRRYEASLPGAVDLVARALRSGASLRQAIAEAAVATAGPAGRDLEEVARRSALGEPLPAALDAWAGWRPSAGVRLAATALALGAEAGGTQARALDGVAATLRDRLAVAGEVRALTSQARLSAAVIGLAPLAFCAFNAAADRRTAAFLLRTPLGLSFLVAGLALDGAAALWMHRITEAGG